MQYSVRIIRADERNKELRDREVVVIIMSDIRRGAPWHTPGGRVGTCAYLQEILLRLMGKCVTCSHISRDAGQAQGTGQLLTYIASESYF